MGLNPQNETAGSIGTNVQEIVGLEGATVTDTQSHTVGDNVGHEIEVKPDTIDTTTLADVAIGQIGDVTIPEEGDKVVIGYRVSKRPIVLGARYKETDTIPDFEPGERVIGHPASDSYLRLQADGTVHAESGGGATVELQADGDVVVNGGSTKPVTNVQAASTNSNGGITALDITRTSDVFVP